MAFILHGSCCTSSHGHSHGSLGGHGHSHSPPTDHQRSKYSRLSTCATTTTDEIGHKHHSNDAEHASYVLNGTTTFPVVRSDSICSYRSPSHSRTNSFSGATSQSVLQHRLEEAAAASTNGRHNGHHHHHHHPHTSQLHRSNSADSEIQLHPSNHSHNPSCTKDSVASEPTKNINIQAAAIHVIGDFIQSVGVFIAAVVIYYYVSVVFCPFN